MNIGVEVHSSKNRALVPLAVKEWAVDALCALMLALALAAALFDMAGLAATHAQLLGYCLVGLLVTFVLSRKWWVLPLLVFAGAIASLALWLFDERFPEYTAYLAGFFDWLADGMPQLAPYSYDGSLSVVNMLTVLPFSAIAYLFIRKLFSFTALALFAFALALGLFMADSGALDRTLLLLLATAVCTLPRASGKHAYRQSAPANENAAVDEKDAGRGDGLTVTRFSMQALAIPAAILCVALAAQAAPDEPAKWRSPFVASMVSDLTDLYDFYFSDMRTEGGYSIGRSGYLPLGSRLGGNIAPTRDRVFAVYTDTPMPLRGAVSDTYNGEMWYDGWKNGRFRFGSLFWRSKRMDAFTADLPLGGQAGADLMAQMTDEVTMRVSMLSHGVFDMFTVGSVNDMTQGGSRPAAYFNLQSEVFFASGLRALDEYTFTSQVINRQKQGFRENMLALEAMVAGQSDPYWENVAGRNLYLPDSVPQSVRDLALSITDNLISPYDKATEIENWLAANCTYTYTPGEPPDDMDFVAHFLETRRGYCVYFASAMTVMARSIGIPARYVTGYGLNLDPEYKGDGTRYYATNTSAHAWAELYFYGIGWISFDPLGYDTSVLGEEPLRQPGMGVGQAIALESEEMQEEQEYVPIDPALLEALNQGKREPVAWQWIAGAAAFIVLAMAIAYRVLDTRFFSAYSLERVAKRLPTMRERVDFYYSDIIRQLMFWGLNVQPGDTVRTLTDRAQRMTRLDGVRFAEIGQVVMRQRYGGVDANDEQLRSLFFGHDTLEEHLREALGRWPYFFQRALGLFWLRKA